MTPAWKRWMNWFSTEKRQRGMASAIASEMANRDMHPMKWNLYFTNSLRAIREFEARYGAGVR